MANKPMKRWPISLVIKQCFQLGAILLLHTRDIWQYLETCLIVTAEVESTTGV